VYACRKMDPSPACSVVDAPDRAALPPRPARIASVRALMGTGDPSVRHVAAGIRAITRRSFDRHVVPLIDAHWPALRRLPVYEKLRIGACDLYASAPYTVLFCSPRRPPLVRAVTGLGSVLPLPDGALALLGRGAMEVIGRFTMTPQHRRIVLIASFIIIVDHVLDHCMTEPPAERGRRLEAVIRGLEAPTTPELALTRALAVAFAADLEGDERRAVEAATLRVYEWIHAEVRAMRGEPDPLGMGHHLAGIEGGIDGLLAPLVRYATEEIRRWMYDVSRFMQVMDDYLDYEIDLASNRATPVVRGEWTFADVEATWRRTLGGLDALVHAAGIGSRRVARFVREAYVLMMVEVMEAMARRPEL
jgi:hypothetical protein